MVCIGIEGSCAWRNVPNAPGSKDSKIIDGNRKGNEGAEHCDDSGNQHKEGSAGWHEQLRLEAVQEGQDGSTEAKQGREEGGRGEGGGKGTPTRERVSESRREGGRRSMTMVPATYKAPNKKPRMVKARIACTKLVLAICHSVLVAKNKSTHGATMPMNMKMAKAADTGAPV